MSFREKLGLIEEGLLLAFKELREQNELIVITSEEDLEEGCGGEFFEVRDDITGETYDVLIASVSREEGILVQKAEDSTKRFTIGFLDLTSTLDRINLVELMQENV